MVLLDLSLKCQDHLIKSGKDHSCFRACFNTHGHEVFFMTAQRFFLSDHQIKNVFFIGSFNTIHLNPEPPNTVQHQVIQPPDVSAAFFEKCFLIHKR